MFLNKNFLLVNLEILFIWLMAGQCKWTLYKLTLIFLNLCEIEASGPKPKILVDCNAAIPRSLYLDIALRIRGLERFFVKLESSLFLLSDFFTVLFFLLFNCDKQKYKKFRCYLYFETFHFPMS